MSNPKPFKNFEHKDFVENGRKGGRVPKANRIHLNNVARQKAYRLRKIEKRLADLREKELLKPVGERKQYVLNLTTKRMRINVVKRK
jgi:hypothetical protein